MSNRGHTVSVFSKVIVGGLLLVFFFELLRKIRCNSETHNGSDQLYQNREPRWIGKDAEGNPVGMNPCGRIQAAVGFFHLARFWSSPLCWLRWAMAG